jgi:peptide-methionine (R)-S-oxide reductase
MKDKLIRSEAEWRAELTDEQYRVTREGATERPFTGRYVNCKQDGVYRCVCCGQELFASDTKYDSGSGWPSFTRPAGEEAVATRRDTSHGMIRDEVVCAKCDAHLGHVFPDGPGPERLRFCINSAALDLNSDNDGDAGEG